MIWYTISYHTFFYLFHQFSNCTPQVQLFTTPLQTWQCPDGEEPDITAAEGTCIPINYCLIGLQGHFRAIAFAISTPFLRHFFAMFIFSPFSCHFHVIFTQVHAIFRHFYAIFRYFHANPRYFHAILGDAFGSPTCYQEGATCEYIAGTGRW